MVRLMARSQKGIHEQAQYTSKQCNFIRKLFVETL
jgi:hypothetical protein